MQCVTLQRLALLFTIIQTLLAINSVFEVVFEPLRFRKRTGVTGDGRFLYFLEESSMTIEQPEGICDRRYGVYNLAIGNWTLIGASGECPPDSFYYSLVYFERKIYVFGASDNDGSGRLYILDLDFNIWTLAPSTISPDSRQQPNLFFYKRKLYMYGGNKYLIFNQYAGMGDLWSYDLVSRQWTMVDYDGQIHPKAVDSVVAFAEGKIYVCTTFRENHPPKKPQNDADSNNWASVNLGLAFFSGASGFTIRQSFCIFGWLVQQDIFSQRVYCLDFVSGNMTGYDSSLVHPEGRTLPLKSTLPSSYGSFISYQGQAVLVGGSHYSVASSYVWFLDTERFTWRTHMNKFSPSERVTSQLIVKNQTHFALYGGTALLPEGVYLNDVWLFDTESYSWSKDSEENICAVSMLNCSPNLDYQVSAIYLEDLYLIGGRYLNRLELTVTYPIARKFSFVNKTWAPFSWDNPMKSLYDPITLFACGYALSGSQLWIAGGIHQYGRPAPHHVFILDLANYTAKVEQGSGGNLFPRAFGRGLFWNSRFCLFGGERPAQYIYSDLICYNPISHSWVSTATSGVCNLEMGSRYTAFTFGQPTLLCRTPRKSIEPEIQLIPSGSNRWMPTKTTTLSNLFEVDSAVIMGASVYNLYFPTATYHSIAITKGTLGRLFCDGSKELYVEKTLTLTDGSNNFDYFPDTSCSWTVQGATWFTVDSMDLLDGASLVFSLIECPCPEPPTASRSTLLHHELVVGQSYYIPTPILRIDFSVDVKAISAQGFSITFHRCSVGFIVKGKECICPVERFINEFGNCVLEKKYLAGDAKSPILGPADEATDVNLIWGSYLGNAAILGDLIIFINGIGTSSRQDKVPYLRDGMLKYLNKSEWWEFHLHSKRLSGNPPDQRYGACLVSSGEAAYLLGGVSLGKFQPYVFLISRHTLEWASVAKFPFPQSEGSFCVLHQDRIHMIGGSNLDGSLNKRHDIFHLGAYNWTQPADVSKLIPMSYASGTVYKDAIYMFGGWDGEYHTSFLQVFNMTISTWISLGNLKIGDCFQGKDMSASSLLARSEAMYFSQRNYLFIYGGRKETDTKSDVLYINLDSGSLVYRQDFVVQHTDYGLHSPSPRAGASFLTIDNHFLVFGGRDASLSVSADAWSWEIGISNWSFNSLRHFPLPRWSYSATLANEDIYIFGGLTPYYQSTNLNDLWKFSLERQEWTLMAPHRRDPSFPTPRAQAILFSDQEALYVFGSEDPVNDKGLKLWKIIQVPTPSWEQQLMTEKLSILQRPHLRVGLMSAQSGSTVWLFGGRIPYIGYENEMYGSLFSLDVRLQTISSREDPLVVPPRRFAGYLVHYNGSLWLFGGKTFRNQQLYDFWQYSFESNTWRLIRDYTNIPSTSISATLYRNRLFVYNDDINYRLGSYWIIDIETSIVQQGAEHSFVLPYFATGSTHTFTNQNLIGFGGLRRGQVSDRIYALTPSFCPAEEVIEVKGAMTHSSFGDGSVDQPYLPGTFCKWRIWYSTKASVKYCLGENDTLTIVAHSQADDIQIVTIRGCGPIVNLESRQGFNVTFMTKDLSVPSTAGFEIVHYVCPKHSAQQGALGCNCIEGYYPSADGISCIPCNPDTKNKDCKSISFGQSGDKYTKIVAITASCVAFAFILVGAKVFYFYSARVRAMDRKNERRLLLFPQSELRLLGSMTSKSMHNGLWKGIAVAVKQIPLNQFRGDLVEVMEDIIPVLSNIRHPSILLYMGATFSSQDCYIVYEYMENQSLYDMIEKDVFVSFATRSEMLMQIAQAMSYLHSFSPKIIHGNLTSFNILLDRQFRAKVADMSFVHGRFSAEFVDYEKCRWYAPEIISGETATVASDAYSFAIITWEVLVWSRPFPDAVDSRILAFCILLEYKRPEIPQGCPFEVQQILHSCFSSNTGRRLEFDAIIKALKSHQPSDYQISMRQPKTRMHNKPSEGGSIQRFRALVVMVIEDYSFLLKTLPVFALDMVASIDAAISQKAQENGGIVGVSKTMQRAVAFTTCQAAARFAMEVQQSLLGIPWPPDVLSHPSCAISCKGELFGFRIKMGLATGHSEVHYIPKGNSQLFVGQVVSHATSIALLALGGQILADKQCYEEVASQSHNPIFTWKEYALFGSQPGAIYELHHHAMTNREAFFQSLGTNLAVKTEHLAAGGLFQVTGLKFGEHECMSSRTFCVKFIIFIKLLYRVRIRNA
eukprot:TRINITY_DN4537_c0_g1_i1.p1 TRINITY_DN4537_c0_g1~~TRINITY_DN4537_c0_g1_i1.p1  ORF type:complete len:2198 (+),score=309.47 TRINITY_DN4537_c0_g1_i1:50-6643(+)